MRLFGEDFRAARFNWLYPAEKQQAFWRSVGFFVLLFGLSFLLQLILCLSIYTNVFGASLASLKLMTPLTQATYLKSAVIGMFPASLPVLFLGLYLAKFGLPARLGVLPLRWPKLGALGWVLVIFGFIVIMFIATSLIYSITGFDAAKDKGLVEQTMAELASDPRLFAFALPSIVLAAPLAEEFLFRGILFAGLTNTIVGKTGAVLITSVLWALAHGGTAPWVNVGVLFMMGLVLGALLLRFGSLWVTIACHTAWNTMTSLAIFSMGAQH
jgi:uncharacterized protein